MIAFALLAALVAAGLLTPMFIRQRKCRAMSEEISNLRQIGLALFEFETEYGTFPDKTTAVEVTANRPNHGLDLSGNSSNALFRQLIAAGITQSEQMFYAKVPGVSKPDGNISPGEALKKGEVAFGYVSSLSTAGNPLRIIAFAPIIPGTTRFDPKPFDGQAVFLRIDNSVSSIPINKDGHALHQGHNLLSPDHPVWNGHTPKIHHPEFPATPKPSFFQKLFSN